MINKKTQLIQQKKTKTLPKKIIPKDKNLLHNKFLIIIKKILNICGNKKRKNTITRGGAFYSQSLKSKIEDFLNNEMENSLVYFKKFDINNVKIYNNNIYNDQYVKANLKSTSNILFNLITAGHTLYLVNYYNYLNNPTTPPPLTYTINNKVMKMIKTIDQNITITFFTFESSFNDINKIYYMTHNTNDNDNYNKKINLLNYWHYIISILYNIANNIIQTNFPEKNDSQAINTDIYYGMLTYNEKNDMNDIIYKFYKYKEEIKKQIYAINDEPYLNLKYFEMNLLKEIGNKINKVNGDDILKHAAIINIGITLDKIKSLYT